MQRSSLTVKETAESSSAGGQSNIRVVVTGQVGYSGRTLICVTHREYVETPWVQGELDYSEL